MDTELDSLSCDAMYLSVWFDDHFRLNESELSQATELANLQEAGQAYPSASIAQLRSGSSTPR